MEQLQEMADSYRRDLAQLRNMYTITHYRNFCGMLGVFNSLIGGGAIEVLVEETSEVNCPYCKPRTKKRNRKKAKK